MTNLPSSEEAFEKSKPMATGSLDQVLSPNGVTNLQPLGGIVLTAAMFGRNLLHLHRPQPEDRDDDINGGFWNRHRQIEQILLQTSLGLPDHLRLPAGMTDPNVVFSNMCIHTSAICLHQAAIFKADKHRLPAHVSNESKIRCVTAAAEIASIMRMISHMDLGTVSTIEMCPKQYLTSTDEPIHIILCLCSSTCIRAVSEDPAEGPTDELLVTISTPGNASTAPQESSHRVVPGPIILGSGKCWYPRSRQKTISPPNKSGK
jgi:hypothetical protein